MEAPEIMGPGVALFDYDGDGDLDILQLRMQSPDRPGQPAPNRLFEQQADGTFRVKVTGLEDPSYAQGVAVGDVDADGDLDVYLVNYGHDALYLNDGAGMFHEATEQAGIQQEGWNSTAIFCDADGDADLDLFVVRYLDFAPGTECIGSAGIQDYCSPKVFPGLPDVLYINDGSGRFTDATASLGIVYPDDGRSAKGLGVLCADLTGDGLVDFYVGNDRNANNLWVQGADGSFQDEAVIRGVAVNRFGKPEASMGLAFGDTDLDGSLDLFMTHLGGENNTLYAGSDGAFYRDRTGEGGMAAVDWALTGFGTALADFDRDGDLDLVIGNGKVRHGDPLPGASLGDFWNLYAEPNLLFENDGTGRFLPALDLAGEFGMPIEITRGLAVGDLDLDGDLDLIIANGDNSLRLYRNDAPVEGSHWLSVLPVFRNGVEAMGSRIIARFAGGQQMAVALRGGSYQSSRDPPVYFGLGAIEEVDRIEVVWPDGSTEEFPGGAVDRRLILRQGEGAQP